MLLVCYLLSVFTDASGNFPQCGTNEGISNLILFNLKQLSGHITLTVSRVTMILIISVLRRHEPSE